MQHEPELFCDSASGIYIPQRFATEIARELVSGVSEEDYSILETGPEHEFYWDVWDSVLNSAIITFEDTTWFLYQNGDLWIVPEDYENADFF